MINPLLQAFWKKANLPAGLLDTLHTAPLEDGATPPDDYPDANALADDFVATQKSVIIQNANLFDQAHMDKEFNTYRASTAQLINKTLGMGLSRSEIGSTLTAPELKAFMGKAKTWLADELESQASGGDEALRESLRALKEEKISWLQEKETLEDTFEARVTSETEKLNRKVIDMNVNQHFANSFKRLKWADDQKEVQQEWIEASIRRDYEVDATGALTMDGGKKAINHAGNGHYATIDEAVDYLYQSKSMDPKHRKSPGPRAPVVIGKTIVGEVSEATQGILDRAAAFRERGGM